MFCFVLLLLFSGYNLSEKDSLHLPPTWGQVIQADGGGDKYLTYRELLKLVLQVLKIISKVFFKL